MSEAKFTKGPWIAQTHDGEVKHAVIYLNGGGFDISACPDSAANAHLIAAAPEMYEELNGLKDGLEYLISKSVINALYLPALHQQVESINALLAKARGEQ